MVLFDQTQLPDTSIAAGIGSVYWFDIVIFAFAWIESDWTGLGILLPQLLPAAREYQSITNSSLAVRTLDLTRHLFARPRVQVLSPSYLVNPLLEHSSPPSPYPLNVATIGKEADP